MQATIRWHAEARRMRAQGHGAREIAALVGKSHSAVKWVFSQGKPAAPAGPATTRKPSARPGALTDKAAKPARRPSAPSSPALSAGAKLVEPHVPRVPRVTLDQAVLQAAALAFARGDIDRQELFAESAGDREDGRGRGFATDLAAGFDPGPRFGTWGR